MNLKQEWIFGIAAKPFTESSAGIKAKYVLQSLISEFGLKASIIPIGKTKYFDQKLLFKTQSANSCERVSVAIYDESIYGNPLGADIVIRWFLNRPGAIYDAAKFNSPNELQYVFAQEINSDLKILNVNTVDFDFFKNSESRLRTNALFYSGKNRAIGTRFTLPKNTIEIHRSGKQKQSRTELRDLLQSSRVLYLAEDSAIALESAIAGCPVVFLQNYFSNQRLNSNLAIGVAKTDSDWDLRIATEDCKRIVQYENEIILRSYNSVANFLVDVFQHPICKPKGQLKEKMPWFAIQLSRINLITNSIKNNGARGIIGTINSYFSNRNYK